MLSNLRLIGGTLRQNCFLSQLVLRGLAQQPGENPCSPGKSSSTDALTNEEPINFFGSQAATWRASYTRSGGNHDEVLWYQPYVISVSLGIFLLYFCVLREENDIDRKLEGNLFDHVEGLEELQLTIAYNYNKEHGLETQQLENRLKELGVDLDQLETKRLSKQN